MAGLEDKLTSSSRKLNSFLETVMSKIDFIAKAQALILSYFEDYSCITFYSGAIIAIWVLTGFKTVSSCRLPCLSILVLACIVERIFITHVAKISTKSFHC